MTTKSSLHSALVEGLSINTHSLYHSLTEIFFLTGYALGDIWLPLRYVPNFFRIIYSLKLFSTSNFIRFG